MTDGRWTRSRRRTFPSAVSDGVAGGAPGAWRSCVVLPLRPLATAGLVAAFVFLLYTVWWCWRHWRRLWAPATNAFEQIVYANGVRGFGRMLWLFGAVAVPLYRALGSGVGTRRALLMTAVQAAVLFPVYLWCGYWWGRALAAVFGRRDRRP